MAFRAELAACFSGMSPRDREWFKKTPQAGWILSGAEMRYAAACRRDRMRGLERITGGLVGGGELRALIAAGLMLCTAVSPARAWAGPALNQFELKDLEVEVGRWEFQSQNAYSWDQPDRKWIEEAPGEYVFDDNTVVRQRYALELELGITRRLRSRVGIELEQERADGASLSHRNAFDSLELEELALESVFVLVPVEEQGIGFGLLAEYQYTLKSAEPDSLVLGPIIEAEGERWSLLLNPAVVKFFGGSDGDHKLDFTYALQLGFTPSAAWILALEAYGVIERLGDSGRPAEEARLFGDHDQHRLGPIVYYQLGFGEGGTRTELRLGVGFFAGLNRNTPDDTLKLSIEYEF